MKIEIEIKLENGTLRLSGNYEELDNILSNFDQIFRKIEDSKLHKYFKEFKRERNDIRTITTPVVEYSDTDVPIVLHPNLNLKENVLLILHSSKKEGGVSNAEVASALDLSGVPYSPGGLRGTITHLRKKKLVIILSTKKPYKYKLSLSGIQNVKRILNKLDKE